MKYSISRDVLGQEVDTENLHKEIAASSFVENFDGLQVSGDEITVSGTITDQAGLDVLIRDHSPYSLKRAKIEKVLAIDARSREIIDGGFDFDGQHFSLSQRAQTNWLGLLTLKDLFAWPMGITNDDDKTYLLALPDLIPFMVAGSSVVARAVGTGRAFKIAANAASTKEELDAVADER